ncbi:MAG: class I SAM-dependent methyltransferase [Candidatus Binatia bacterium]
MENLLPDELKKLWQCVEAKEILTEEFNIKQERGLAEYRTVWSDALLLEGHEDLQQSLLHELASYTKCEDLTDVERRCRRAVENLAIEWREKVDPTDRKSVESFYNETSDEIYELAWWHTLSEDLSPLSYVNALRFAEREGCRNCLDFGAGVGSGSILFARHGLEVGLADISSPLLGFSQWRFQLRRLPGEFFDMKKRDLPSEAFDMVTAMDVFEHLADPVNAVEKLSAVLKPGGFLFGRFSVEPNEDRPLHIVQDFEPTFRCLRELGFIEVWRDDWVWGHQVFQRK